MLFRSAHKRATTDNRERAAKGRSAKPDHGKGAAETAIRAARWMFERARLCSYVSSNPAADLKVPRRNPSKRRALVGDELDEFFDTVAAGGDDPELDVMLTWFHVECRSCCRETGSHCRVDNRTGDRGAATESMRGHFGAKVY